MPPYKRQLVELRPQLFDADSIFRAVREQITPAAVAALRQPGRRYAFGIDRQSLGAERLRDPEHTGHKGRVALIARTAERFGLWLPEPIGRPNQQKGETPFIFDERYWFIDGEDAKATGFSFAPEIRPRFWHAYATIRRINEIDPGACPSALILADYMRFLRADEWIKVWANAIWKEGVDIIYPETGPVGPMHLDMICVSVRAQSQHLVGYRERFLEVARKEKRIPFGRCPFGLQFSEDHRAVHTHPEQWPVLYEIVSRLADGRLKNASEAARWSRKQHGESLKVSEGLVRKWFREQESILYGYYEPFRFRSRPCVVKQTAGPLYDYSYTKSLNKRYVREKVAEEECFRLPIDHEKHGTTPLTPAQIEAARQRVRQVGRPVTEAYTTITAASIAPARIVRCKHCGGRIRETFRDTPETPEKWAGWVLHCRGAERKASGKALTTREAKTEEPDHPRFVHASLTIPLREALRRWLTEEIDPVLYAAPTAEDAAAEHEALETKRTDLEGKLAQVVANLAHLDLSAAPAVASAVNVEMRRLQEGIADCDRELQLLAARTLQAAAANSAAFAIREQFRRNLEFVGNNAVAWRTLVEGIVEGVTVDLEAGTWVATTNLKVATLEALAGKLQDTDSIRTLPSIHTVCFRAVQGVLTGELEAAA